MKVLVVSHNCFSSSQSMGKTLASLFSCFKKEELMQLYFYPTLPNVDICDDFFRITDRDIMTSLLHRKKCGRLIDKCQISTDNTLYENNDDQSKYVQIRNAGQLMRRFRDILWSVGHWKTDFLKEWLREEKPDVVFYALGDASFSQNIAMWIAKFLNIPLVTYVCDEFYFSGKQATFFNRLINFGMLRNLKKTLCSSKYLITICDELGERYKSEFGIPYTTIMTGSSFEAGSLPIVEKKNQISYIGNLGLNRWRSLLDIQTAVDEFNENEHMNIELVYYGSENEHLKGIVKYGGRLDADGVKTTMAMSKAIIHTESFDPKDIARVKYSVSTKIADSLASGTVILAYGPECVSSMKHLIRNGCAVTITNKADLNYVLRQAFSDHALRKINVQNALWTANNYHISNVNSECLYNVLKNMISSDVSK